MKPRLLDLFCGAGGCAVGYSRAGFDVVGVDIKPQPRYPFPMVVANALQPPFDLREFDAIHASPPCQHYSEATAWRGDRNNHPDLLDATRKLLACSGKPYVIENVRGARHILQFPIMLCGSMFGLPIQRHRYFEAPCLPLNLVPPCQHKRSDYSHDHGGKQTESVYRDAMKVDWMTVNESRQAIPPSYTQYLGERLMQVIKA